MGFEPPFAVQAMATVIVMVSFLGLIIIAWRLEFSLECSLTVPVNLLIHRHLESFFELLKHS